MSCVVARTGVVTVSPSSGASQAKCATRVVVVNNNNNRRRRVVAMTRRGDALTLRAASDDKEVTTSTVEVPPPTATATPLTNTTPASSKPGVGKPPINPVFLALGDLAAAVLITVVARGAAGENVFTPGTLVAIPPFVVGWVGAGYLAGDYDADSPNAALWGDVPRAMTTGALTWFSGSAFAILLRNVEGSMMTFPPNINEQVEFAGGLGLICAFRAAVAVAKPGASDKL